MLGLSLVSTLDKTLDEVRHYDYDDDEFEYTKNTLRGSHVNNAILEDKQFRSIFLGAVRRRSTSGYDLIERYNKHLNRRDDTMFKSIPLEILEVIIFSIREASTLHKLSQTSKRIKIFLSEPRILSSIMKKDYPDDKIVGSVVKGRYSTFEFWYHKTFFTGECTRYNTHGLCANTAFQLKNIDYLIEKKLIPESPIVRTIIDDNEEWFSGVEDRVVEYINLLYSIAEDTVKDREKDRANSLANLLLTKYIEYSARKGHFFELPDILDDVEYEIEFMRSNPARVSIWANLISRGEGKETFDRIMKSSLHYKR